MTETANINLNKSDVDNIITLFNEYEQKRDAQRHRGLNDFNPFTIVLHGHDEVRLHSRFLRYLLDPHADHYQGDLFLQLFLEKCGLQGFFDDSTHCQTYNEYEHIDIYITDGNKRLIIENKIWAGDQPNQLQKHVKKVQDKSAEGESTTEKSIVVMYLSLDRDGKERYPNLESEFSSVKELKSIHYNKEITEWLEEAHEQVANITNLSLGIRQYQEVIQKLYGTYGRKVMNLYDYITDTENVSQDKRRETVQTIQTIEKVIQEYNNCKLDIMTKFFDKVIAGLEGELERQGCAQEWKATFHKGKESDVKAGKHYGRRRLIVQQKRNTGHHPPIYFAFEYSANGYHNPGWGITRSRREVDFAKLKRAYEADPCSGIEFPASDPLPAHWWINIQSVYGEDCYHFLKIVELGEKEAAENFVTRFFAKVITKENMKLVMKLNELWPKVEKS